MSGDKTVLTLNFKWPQEGGSGNWGGGRLTWALLGLTLLGALFTAPALCAADAAETPATIKVGLNYCKTGPYAALGEDQWRASQMALEEINGAGGILGKKVELVWRDSQSSSSVSSNNVVELIDQEKVQMIFGGAASSVAVAASGVCQQKGVPPLFWHPHLCDLPHLRGGPSLCLPGMQRFVVGGQGAGGLHE